MDDNFDTERSMTQTAKPLAERFELQESLGGTGLASVHRARDLSSGAQVVVKVLRSYFSHEQDVVQAFFRELEEVQKLRHPGILAPLAMGMDGVEFWIAYPFVPWETLESVLHRGPLGPGRALALLRQAGQALGHAHAHQVCHGDLKPANIFLGPGDQLLVTDFGMATLARGAHLLVRSTLSTPHPSYTAPEQAQDEDPTPASDLYSLGAIAYQMLTRRVPFSGLGASTVLAKQMASAPPAPSRVNPSLPAACDPVLSRALARHPLERYQRAEAFVDALDAALAPMMASSAPPHPGAPPGSTAPPPASAPARSGPEEAGADQIEAPPQEERYCPVCGQPNTADALNCRACWARLRGRPLLSREQAATLQRLLRRELRVRRTVRLAALLVVMGFLAFFAFNTFYAPAVPRPTSQVSSASGPGEAAMFGLDPVRSAAAPQGPRLAGTQAWRFETAAPLLASPAVVAGVVYQPTGERRVVALDARDGKLLWEHPTSGPVDSTPAVAGSLVYYGQRDGQLVALERETGKPRWARGGFGPILGSPVVYQGAVYVGDGAGRLNALDAQTGEKLWDFQAEGWIVAAVPINGEVVVAATSSGEVYVIDIETGRLRLYYDAVHSISGTPVLAGDRLIITNVDGRVSAVDWRQVSYPLERSIMWWRFHFWVWGLTDSPPVQKGFLWGKSLGRRAGASSPAVLDGVIYVASGAGKLFALDAARGETRWEYDARAMVFSSPSLAGDAVYIGSEDGRLHAVDRGTGRPLWTFNAGGAIRTRPVVAGDTLYVASGNGTLYAVR